MRISHRMFRNRGWIASIVDIIMLISILFSPLPFTGSEAGPSMEVEQQQGNELLFYYPGYEQTDHLMVEEKVNEYLRREIDAELRLIPIDWGSWSPKVKVMFAAGEPMDLLFTAGWSDFHTFANNGMLSDMTSLMNEYTPQLKHQIDPVYLDGTAIDGVNYAIPNQTNSHTWSGILFNEQLVEKYNFDINSITKLADLEPMLRIIQQKEKGVTPIFGKIKDFENLALLERIGSGPGALMPGKGTTLVNEFNTPEMMANLKLFHGWSKKGYIDINKQQNMYSIYEASNSDAKQTFAFVVGGGAPDIAELLTYNSGVSWVAAPLRERYISTSDLLGSMLAIPTTSEHPDKAMKLIELLHTDPYLLNLLSWGIEGYHWTESKTEPNHIDRTDHAGDYNPTFSWMLGNPGLTSLSSTDYYYTDYNKLKQSFNDAKHSPILGFQYNDGTDLEASIQREYSDFILQQDLSPEDPTKALPAFVKVLEESGLEAYIADKQEQLDAFLAEER